MNNEFIEGLEYEVLSVGGLNKDVWQIGAIKNKNEPRHSGNMHFIGKLFYSKQEAIDYLEQHKNNLTSL